MTAPDGSVFGTIEDEPAGDRFVQAVDPARFRHRSARAAAFEAWVKSGRDLDRLPAGLLSGCLGALLGQHP